MDVPTLLNALADIRRQAKLLDIDTSMLYAHINEYELGERDWTPELDVLRAQAQKIRDMFDMVTPPADGGEGS